MSQLQKDCRNFIRQGTVIVFKGRPCHLQEGKYDLLQTYDDHAVLACSTDAMPKWQEPYNFPASVEVLNYTKK
jgi:hypothetical protein